MKLTKIFKDAIKEPFKQPTQEIKETSGDWDQEHERLSKQEIEDWCKKFNIRNYTLSRDGKEFVIDVNGDVKIRADDLPLDDDNMCYFPHRFGEINGNFIIQTNGREKMKSLKNGPYMVGVDYVARNLWLESLEGGPGSVGNSFDISSNQLTSWKGIPSQCGCLVANDNKITSFTGISREWIMGSEFVCDPLEGGVLELLEIEGLDDVKFKHNFAGTSAALEVNKAQRIINHHLNSDRDPIDMQSDFIDAGMKDWVRK